MIDYAIYAVATVTITRLHLRLSKARKVWGKESQLRLKTLADLRREQDLAISLKHRLSSIEEEMATLKEESRFNEDAYRSLLGDLASLRERLSESQKDAQSLHSLWHRGIDKRMDLETQLNQATRDLHLTRLSLAEYETVPELEGDEA